MSKTKFKELPEEYISTLEKDYDSNQTGNSNHPRFSLIQNTCQKIEDKFFYKKSGFTLPFFLFCIVYSAIAIVCSSLPLVFFVVSPFLFLFFSICMLIHHSEFLLKVHSFTHSANTPRDLPCWLLQ